MSEISFIKGLYLVATPIGNLGDISARAINVLKNCDVIACEDTRNTKKLLTLINIKEKQLLSYHEHNADKMRPNILKRLQNGEMIALVSDAGTPLISDPGYRLVQDCIDYDIYVTAIPGASAVLTALQLSGLPCHRFLFEGFLPTKSNARKNELMLLRDIPATLIFYESPQRLEETLNDMIDIFDQRQAAVLRELTKKFEQAVRGSLHEIRSYYKENGYPKGEIVIVVSPSKQKIFNDNELFIELKNALATMSLKDASHFVATRTGESKKKLYQMALKIKDEIR